MFSDKIRYCLTLVIVMLLATAGLAQSYQAWDPTKHTPNARVLGLGRAYVGLADDVGAIYTNPAGMVGINSWQLSSMSGKFLEEYNYYSFNGLYPTDYGVLGMGFAGSSISGAYVARVKEGSDPDDPIYEIDPSVDPVSNANNVFIFSYANEGNIMGYLPLKWGASLKMFMVSMTGDHITNGSATGQELDIGAKFNTPWPWLQVGATAQNVLPFSMGGKLHYETGHEEAYPAVLDTGIAAKIFGQEDAFRTFPQDLLLLLDLEYYPTINNYPMVGHLGLEWVPHPIIALRMGIDQDVVGNGQGTGLETLSNYTSGVGINYAGFRFDYAYMENKAAPGIGNSYFSFAFGVPVRQATKVEEVKDKISILTPQDKLLTFASQIPLRGRVNSGDIERVFINGSEVEVKNKEFLVRLPLVEGKNMARIEGFSKKGKLEAAKEVVSVRILRLRTFPDVGADNWAREQISLIAMAGIIKGYPDGTFRPDGQITRAEMATLLMKTKGQTAEASELTFSDVVPTHWAAPYIAQAVKDGVVKGYPDGTFRPNGDISRAEGVTMIARFADISEEAFVLVYPDVVRGFWAAGYITGAYKDGILKFIPAGSNFEPANKLNRAEVVEMLRQSRPIKTILDSDLLDWQSYESAPHPAPQAWQNDTYQLSLLEPEK